MVSLGERMGYLQLLRASLALVILVSAVVAADVVGAGIEDLLPVTVGYLALSAAGEGLRRAGRMRGLLTVGGMLLVDGLFLAWVMYLTGGTQSPLRFLVYVHLIAVTLLASYRTGLKIALWHSLLFFVVFYAQVSGIVPLLDSSAEAATSGRPSAFNVVAFWVVALATTAFSSVNERELRRRKADVEALAGMASRLEPRHEPREVAAELLEAVCTTFDFGRGIVAGGQNGVTELLAYRGPGEAPAVPPCTGGLVRRVVDERRAVLAKGLDPETDEWLNLVLPFGRNLVAVPLSAEGQPVGALVVEHPGRRVERRVVAMLGQFAAHAALALRNSWLLQQVQRLAETDGLTGLANRRTFEATLERELSRAARSGEPVTLVMVDVDHFKLLNDKHGHQAGDEVLEEVASVLASVCRDFDTAARYGGEEFVVILPSCSSAESLVVAERLRESIEGIETVTPVTASAGVATFPAHAADPEGLIKAADEALYESKRAGRNRVTRSRRRGARTIPSCASPSAVPRRRLRRHRYL
jgi:diguanylate cyclase (GGDEF)-like protein